MIRTGPPGEMFGRTTPRGPTRVILICMEQNSTVGTLITSRL